MRWLKNIFSNKAADASIEVSAQAVLPFLRAAHQHIDLRYFMTPRHHTLIYCFAYGALGIEATERDMDESRQLAALLLILQTLSEMSPQEISGMLGRCMQALDEKEGHDFVLTGARTYSDWRQAEPTASQILAEKLQELR